MKIPPRDAVRITLAYADIFSYPLTTTEITYWLIGRRAAALKQLHQRELHFLPGRQSLVRSRHARENGSLAKWQIARKIGGWLKLIPTLKLVGVTGGLAMNNAKKDDDIDLFLVTARGTLWVSRFLTTALVEISGKRRRPGETYFKDKICLNMFMAEDHLTLHREERDLFAAHEVLQMQPLWERHGTYYEFLKANQWVKKFLPNAWKEKYLGVSIKYYGKRSSSFISLILRLLEPFARLGQLWYMRKRRTSEVISRGVIRFHPHDARVWVKQALRRRLLRLNIPLDKVFYGC